MVEALFVAAAADTGTGAVRASDNAWVRGVEKIANEGAAIDLNQYKLERHR